jgi:hypothetical protein
MVRQTVAEILQHHVTFELEAIDRMYLSFENSSELWTVTFAIRPSVRDTLSRAPNTSP